MLGFTYPLEASDGKLKVTSDYPTLVRNAILSSIWTELEERVFRPEYGLGVNLFDSVSNLTTILAVTREAIALGLEDYPNVEFELRANVSDDGQVDLLVVYGVPDEFKARLEVTV